MTIRQLRMLDSIPSRGLTYEQATELNQTVFGSLCYHKWLEWLPGTGRFVISAGGRHQRSLVYEWEIQRKANNHKLAKRAGIVYKVRSIRGAA